MRRMMTRRQTLVAAGGVALGATAGMVLAACGEAEVAETPAEPAPATPAPAPARWLSRRHSRRPWKSSSCTTTSPDRAAKR